MDQLAVEQRANASVQTARPRCSECSVARGGQRAEVVAQQPVALIRSRRQLRSCQSMASQQVKRYRQPFVVAVAVAARKLTQQE